MIIWTFPIPAHGGSDPGASGNGIIEKNMTLDISKEMYNEFKRLGIPVYMTRDTDESLSPTERVNRVKRFISSGDDVIVISNHINAGGGEGSEVIYALRNNEKLSQNILNELAGSGQKIRKYYQKRGTSNPNLDYYYMLRDTTPYESVIVEYGFLDNARDAEKLKNNYKTYAKDVVDAVLDYKGIIPEDEYYTVKKGDTLYSIARRFNLTVDKLKDLNNLTNSFLSVGKKLKVKGEKEDISESISNVYTVVPGDTLYSIAKKHNTTVNNLKALNNISSNMLSVGQKLVVPSYNTYVVVPGDTLYGIAKKFNTTVDNLKDLNNLSSNLLFVNQELLVP